MRLKDRVAVVTGGATGLGKCIALRLARDGARLVLASPEAEALEQTAGEIAAQGGAAASLVTDVTSEEQVAALAQFTAAQFGPADILINNAGIQGPTGLVTGISLEEWQQTIAVNLTGAFLCCKWLVPPMLQRRSGKIVNISSIAGKIGYSLRSPYAASKWGLIGLSRTLAKELGPYNIQVNTVCPGPVAGDRMRRVVAARAAETGKSTGEVQEEYDRQTALGRMVQPDDVAAMVAFLASSEADNVTGEAIEVSAGWNL